jgi:hypothetical protein
MLAHEARQIHASRSVGESAIGACRHVAALDRLITPPCRSPRPVHLPNSPHHLDGDGFYGRHKSPAKSLGARERENATASWMQRGCNADAHRERDVDKQGVKSVSGLPARSLRATLVHAFASLQGSFQLQLPAEDSCES